MYGIDSIQNRCEYERAGHLFLWSVILLRDPTTTLKIFSDDRFTHIAAHACEMELQNHYPVKSEGTIAGVGKTYASEKSMIVKGGKNITEFSGAFDFVIVFPMQEVTEADGSFRREQSDTAKHVMHAMLNAGLEIYPYLSVQDDELLVLFRAPVGIFFFNSAVNNCFI